MWYEALPPAIIIVVALNIPGLALHYMNQFGLGNAYGRILNDRWAINSYKRDRHLTGDPYVVNVRTHLNTCLGRTRGLFEGKTNRQRDRPKNSGKLGPISLTIGFPLHQNAFGQTNVQGLEAIPDE